MSTAYSHTDRECLEEKFYEPRIEVDRIIKLVDFLEDEDLDKISPTWVASPAREHTELNSRALKFEKFTFAG